MLDEDESQFGKQATTGCGKREQEVDPRELELVSTSKKTQTNGSAINQSMQQKLHAFSWTGII
jgi:hypothetical protein